MNLVLDIGNTRIKAGIFDGDSMVANVTIGKDLLNDFRALENEFSGIKRVLISAVGQLPQSLESYLQEKFVFETLSSKTKLPIKLLYKTSETLGSDRIALAVGGWYTADKGNALVIDMGTCITYDIVNENGEYLGGAISPGLQMRYNSLNLMTASLPSLQPRKDVQELIGTSTQDSIHSGVQYGILDELQGMIRRYQNQFPKLTVIMTGGDKIYFEEQLKNVIFADSNLVLFGLNKILLFNELH